MDTGFPGRLRALEFFCGIGGFAAAVDGAADVVAAVDTNRNALAVYSRNFGHEVLARTIESLRPDDLRRLDADLWWLSPPCQPYTRRGHGRDVDDPRAASYLVMLERIREIRPAYVALENVPAFEGSRAHGRLLDVLGDADYHVRSTCLCPTEIGFPNRRRRFYLVAAQALLDPWPDRDPTPRCRVVDVLDPDPDVSLWLTPEVAADYWHALDRVDPAGREARTSCFTASYGRAIVRSGSYLLTPRGPRRFSPAEILRLLGFPAGFVLPARLSREQTWSLVGNSLSVPAVRFVLAAIPELRSAMCAPLDSAS